MPSPPPSLQELRNEAKLEAPLAVQGQSGHAGFFPFNKFSTVPLLIKAAREAANQSGFDNVKKRLMVVARCHVIRLNTVPDIGGQRVSEIVTERGPLPVSPDAKVIIALGTIESARLALLSFGNDGKIGRNLMAHLRSNVDIRVPRSALAALPATAKALEASALLSKVNTSSRSRTDPQTASDTSIFKSPRRGWARAGQTPKRSCSRKSPISTRSTRKRTRPTLTS